VTFKKNLKETSAISAIEIRMIRLSVSSLTYQLLPTYHYIFICQNNIVQIKLNKILNLIPQKIK